VAKRSLGPQAGLMHQSPENVMLLNEMKDMLRRVPRANLKNAAAHAEKLAERKRR